MTERETTAERGAFDRVRNGFRRLHARMHRNRITGLITKVVVTGMGVLVIGAGLVMMVTPGPGIVGIIVGLGILSTEWHWAERLMHSMKEKAKAAADHARELDPAVRRRRLLLTSLAVVVVVGRPAGVRLGLRLAGLRHLRLGLAAGHLRRGARAPRDVRTPRHCVRVSDGPGGAADHTLGRLAQW